MIRNTKPVQSHIRQHYVEEAKGSNKSEYPLLTDDQSQNHQDSAVYGVACLTGIKGTIRNSKIPQLQMQYVFAMTPYRHLTSIHVRQLNIWIQMQCAASIRVEANPEGQVTFVPILHHYVMNMNMYYHCILIIPGERRLVSPSVHVEWTGSRSIYFGSIGSGKPLYYIHSVVGYTV